MRKLALILNGLVLLSLLQLSYALDNKTVLQTKNKLKEIDTQIVRLKQTLANANDKRGVLNTELATTEKQIGQSILQLRAVQRDMSDKQRTIGNLQQKIDSLNQQLTHQQQSLAQHIRACHKIGQYEPIKLLLNQEEPYSLTRLLTYYQYIIHSRQHIIDTIANTRREISLNQESLQEALSKQQALRQELNQHQQDLEHNKQYHTTLIHSIDKDIQNKQQSLGEFERNKTNLSRLLETLATQSVVQPHLPTARMPHKLPKPVNVDKKAITSMNQGVTFFAGEGTAVSAVYPGKVVFSDWLNGYGLLLIIDHGHGFMTLYAHNQALFKTKGDSVSQGEQIAAVGHSGGLKQNGLYFEVRQHGKAVPPLDWLS